MFLIKHRDRLAADMKTLSACEKPLDMSDWNSYGGCEDEAELAAGALALIAFSGKSGLIAQWYHDSNGVKFAITTIGSSKRNIEAAAEYYGISRWFAETLFLRSSYVKNPGVADVVLRIDTLLDFGAEEEETVGGYPEPLRREAADSGWNMVVTTHNELIESRAS